MLSANEGIKRAKNHARLLGGDFLSTTWSNTRAKYLWRCKNKHTWESSYCRVVRNGFNSSWCRQCLKLNPDVGISRIKEKCKLLNLELLDCKWENTNSKYPVRCLKCAYEFCVNYGSLVRYNSSCKKCQNIKIKFKNTLKTEEVAHELEAMGIKIESDFSYSGIYDPITGISFKGRRISRTLGALRRQFAKTSIPIGFAHGSSEDAWMGFVCSFASPTCEYLSRPLFLKGLSFDIWDPKNLKACEFNGPRHDADGTFKNSKDTDNVVKRDLLKLELSKVNGINLKVFHWRNYPKDKIEQAELILDHMFPEMKFKIIENLKALKDIGELDRWFLKWCDTNGVFNKKNNFQNSVKKYLLENGIPKRGTYEYGRFHTVVTPKGCNFNNDIRSLAIQLGYRTHND